MAHEGSEQVGKGMLVQYPWEGRRTQDLTLKCAIGVRQEHAGVISSNGQEGTRYTFPLIAEKCLFAFKSQLLHLSHPLSHSEGLSSSNTT